MCQKRDHAHLLTFATQEEGQNLCISSDGMSYNPRKVSLKITATRFHKVATEKTRIMFLRERRKGNSGEAARQGSMQHRKMRKSSMDSDA